MKNKAVKRVYILLLLFVVMLIGIRMAWSSGSSVVKLPSPLSETNQVAPSKFRIVIDAGHGGKDPGATGNSGAYEKEFNLSLAQHLYQLLEQDPMFETRMTREDDQFIELEDRAAIANDWNADALVSIHANTYEDPSVSGTEALYYHNNSKALAGTLQEQVATALDIRDRGVKKEQLVILSKAQVPAVIVEMGYLTNQEEENKLLSSDGQDRAARAIVEGLKKYFSQRTPRNHTLTEEFKEVPPASLNQDHQQIENKIYFNGSAKDGKQVALTFDDGPDRIVTPNILEVLIENDIKATFFILGNRAEANPDLVRRIAEDGHAVGNHSWSHPNFDEISMDEAMKEIEDTQEVLEDAIGYRPSLFRPPYGALSDDKRDQLHQMNLAVVNWTVDTMDWSGNSSEEIMKLVHEQLNPGGIVLQHTANGKNHLANTIEALKQMIPELKAEGYSFVTVSELLNLPASQSD
ncbi:N-acetylmuramoyl-L-alanine amidase [Paenibacillus macerans]|uniref:N-acetylmuramoyl-L-alanine amidase n=1 Tax=Paenibacillus macerans TaxID=44252 RepID=UPI003D31C74F